MLARPLALPCLILVTAASIAAAVTTRPTAAAPAPPAAPPLPDSTVLARVNDRAIRADRFVDAYFASYGPVRPKPDSLGRVEFLNSMINKEVMALTALQVNKPLEFEDRTVMREHTERVLSNALYFRAVTESVVVSDEDVRKFYAQYGREQRYRRIGYDDPYTAAAAREQIIARKLAWNDAARRSPMFDAAHPDGDIGWIKRDVLDPRTASQVWDLAAGQISPVINAQDGFFLMQLVESRKVDLPAFEPMRRVLESQLRELAAADRASRLQTQVGARIGMAYDTTNIRWAAAKFHGVQAVKREGREMTLDLGEVGGDLEPADTSRVLARHRDGRFTLGDFVHEYNHQSPMMRQPVGDFETFRAQLDAIVLEPYMAEEARVRDLEKDPIVVAQVAQKREELLVDHLYADSVESRVYVSSADRHRYYDQHQAQFVTFASVRYAAIVRGSEAGADSVMARLKAGEKAENILHADSLAGFTSGSIKETRDEGHGGQYNKILFGELRPGQSTVVGPDKEGTWMVLQLLEFNPPRQLPYERVEPIIDESLQNIRSEEMLKALIKRLSKRYKIESHPEWVMRVRFQDPAGR